MHAMQSDDAPGEHVGGAADDGAQRRGTGGGPASHPTRADRHAAASGDEGADKIGDLAGVVMTVGVEGDEEVAVAVAQEVLEAGQL